MADYLPHHGSDIRLVDYGLHDVAANSRKGSTLRSAAAWDSTNRLSHGAVPGIVKSSRM